jgi:hypothetical protein
MINKEDLWTAEINLNADPTNELSYHVDRLDRTLESNFKRALIPGPKTNWMIFNICSSHDEASQSIKHLKESLCRMYDKNPSGMHEAYDQIEENKE